jgi:exo-beta-1,3-glucanase (GH17 family)
MMRLVSSLVIVLVTSLAGFGGWWWCNRPVPLDLSFNEPFPSVSFAPFRRHGLFQRDESPLTQNYPSVEGIDSDLKSLVGVARGVRTYTSLEGMDVVPVLAAKYGLEVTHSAWLGAKLPVNDKEVAALIVAANAHPDTIKRVIVGNEVLLRQDLTADQLIAYIREVRKNVRQPVSYADVWAFWLKNPQLADEVDYITIHILPYWEDEPVSVDDAAAHIIETLDLIRKTFPDKPILIGESGWPTRGRDRGPAVANMVEGARFVRILAKLAHERGFDYNVVEAFDQPWKAKMEGTVGANWGVVDGHRRVKYAMSGPVQENQDWPYHAALSVFLGAAATIWALKRAPIPAGRAAALAVLAQGLAALTVWQAINAWWLGYDLLGDSLAVLRIGLHAWLARSIVKAAASDGMVSGWAARLVPFYGACAVLSTFLLLVNGRYRDIPNLEFLVPCFGITAYALLRMVSLPLKWEKAFAINRLFSGATPGHFRHAKRMTIALWLSVAAAPLSEAVALALGDDFITMHPTMDERLPLLAQSLVGNPEMLVWSLMLAVMSLPFWAEWRLAGKR